MKQVAGLFLALLITSGMYAQDSIRHRVIFIGDILGNDKTDQVIQQQMLKDVIPNRTSVIFLDESKYLKGKIEPGSKDEAGVKALLSSQFLPVRKKAASVYFIPGNHKWNKSGSNLQKIEQEKQFLHEQDSSIGLISGTSCPAPYVINLTDSTMIIVFNSEWWLFPENNVTQDDSCECKTKMEVLARLDELRYRNSHKFIFFVSHHPFQSYGIHDGKYTWKDHIFPMTSAHKDLYLPLPVVGSVYCFFRSAFSSPNDIKHSLHRTMVKTVDEVFADFPNLIYVAGHEDGMQLIKGQEVQMVTGPGVKHIKPQKAKPSLFADNSPGYVVADVINGSNVQLNFYRLVDNDVQLAYTYRQPYVATPANFVVGDTGTVRDSVIVQVHPSYNSPGKIHRWLFGENYRKEWSAPTRLPLIWLSAFKGGLKPLQRGGGMQSQSLRLVDKNKVEWVVRSVEKSPDALLPAEFRQTFARDWLDDATSAQHPFSALVVPPIANAVKVPHAIPVVGVIAADTGLGIYGRTFINTIVLLEEREPQGKSDNTAKMKRKLQEDNDNTIEARQFLNARMLDVLLGDWDRHEDQWRWKDISKDKAENYLGVPRDRDQVFHLTQGLIPKMASRSYILPTLRNFDPGINKVKWLLFKTRFVNAYPEFQFDHRSWMEQAGKFKLLVTDSVLEAGLRRLPKSSYDLRHDELFKKLQSRRDRIPVAMDQYYKFIQKVADIQTSDKNERIQLSDATDGGLQVRINKINKNGEVQDELMNKTFDAGLTKEIRLFVRDGNDSIIVNSLRSPIKIRIIGGRDRKAYNLVASKNKIRLYDKPNGSVYYGDSSQFKKYISDDSLHTAFTPVNLYNVWMPLTVVGMNVDDGFVIGAGFKYIRQEGFRKFPYAGVQQLQAGYFFSTGAYRIGYNGEWIEAIGKADIQIQALARAPNNTVNFFGRGNETEYIKTGDYKQYYRTRYSTYQVDPALRWRKNNGSSFSIGPSLYFYLYDDDDNKGRFIENTSEIGSYDSLTIEKEKWHLGIAATYARDKRNNAIFPQWGSYFHVRLQVYEGMGEFAKSFAQLQPEIALYKSLNPRASIVIAERMGGVIGFGNSAFYQSAFVGGHGNLLGYRQYRYAGQHSFYNNFELRIKLAEIASYILPGQFGISGFWDTGRVWEKDEKSGKWHHGVGAGIYFVPASIISLNFLLGYSGEGLYPYFTMGFRF